MSMTVVLAIISLLGGGAGIASLVRALMEKKKLRADEAATITQAAGEYVGSVRDELRENREEMAKVRAENAEIKALLFDYSAKLQLLSRWALRAYRELRGHGSEIEPPPHLTLPFEDERPTK